MQYTVRKTSRKPKFDGDWDGPVWSKAEALQITHFYRPRRSNHRPKVQAKLLYDKTNLYVMFKADDRYVRATREDWQAAVCRDSCVEFFVRPKPDKGYFNFEMNCGGTLLVYYIEDESRTPTGFRKFTELPYEWYDAMRIYHSLPKVVYPEIKKPTIWYVEYSIPLKLFEEYVGKLGDLAGQEWRGNFYKCGDETSHPHWASWAPLEGPLTFHVPQFFQPIRFSKT